MREDVGFEAIGDIVSRIVDGLAAETGRQPMLSAGDTRTRSLDRRSTTATPGGEGAAIGELAADAREENAPRTSKRHVGRMTDNSAGPLATTRGSAAIGEFGKNQRISALEFGSEKRSSRPQDGCGQPADLRSAAPIPLASGKLLRMRA